MKNTLVHILQGHFFHILIFKNVRLSLKKNIGTKMRNFWGNNASYTCNYDVFYYDVIVTIESKTSTWESGNLRRCLIYLVVLEEGDKEGVR